MRISLGFKNMGTIFTGIFGPTFGRLVPTVPNAPGLLELSVHNFAPPAHHGSLPPPVGVSPRHIPLMASFGNPG